MLLDAHVGVVQLVFRHYPMEASHPDALLAAEAAEAAGAQGRFWAMHDLLLEQGAPLQRPALDRYAEKLGLDMPLFKHSLDEAIYLELIREQMQSAIQSQVLTTPGFFVNGHLQDVSGGMHALREAIIRLL